MPVTRYFLFVGGVLLALLLAIDALVPEQAGVASQAVSSVDKTVPSIDKTIVRIRSDQKLPERVVFDTSLPTIVPPPAMTAQAIAPSAPATAPADAAQGRARETFAQYVPAEAKKPEPPVQRKRKVARSRPAPSMQFAQPPQVRVAQQSQFGFFGGPSWNTW
ncbi:hypothetical protein [Bradyrhizobium sp. sGM-13]|uniref:hypothetical protein n=1 Tax=Bradyrhizobium sp. sGM-13 TaxID=2831781 RepID=UPI001BCA74A5|nr:hypothetical protein [Bradyrhizobium sp. sGM-13]